MSLTTLLVPTYNQVLRTLSGKAQAQLPIADADALLPARPAPDMFPYIRPESIPKS